ncbi:ras-related protein Rab-34 [Onthophagus taurus]|uniref:ras-related protein Rab-34 n=1 Tax=Onthophagus taurus TaxID=166361 RepID=UPI000C20959A|nr:ras-related protein Rab-34-like [Onthophagus taurus]
MKKGILKMVAQEVDNRQILTIPPPYKKDSTPYKQKDFCDITREMCFQYGQDIISELKICKVIIVGDLSVGKTCIINRFCRQIFATGYKATIGVDFDVERFDILNVPFHLQIWDTAGQERFKSIAQSYYRSAHVIIVVFDFTSIATLAHCKKWLEEALDASMDMDPFLFLVGSKIDLVSNAAYNNIEQSAMDYAKKLDMEYWPVSSRTGDNISKLFLRIASLSFDKIISNEKLDSLIPSKPIVFNQKSVDDEKKLIGKCVDAKCKNF